MRPNKIVIGLLSLQSSPIEPISSSTRNATQTLLNFNHILTCSAEQLVLTRAPSAIQWWTEWDISVSGK